MKKFFGFIFIVIILLVGVIFFKGKQFKSQQLNAIDTDVIETISDDVFERLAKAIQIPTVSYQDSLKINFSLFDSLHQHVSQSFPLVDSFLVKTKINHSLLFEWKGKNEQLKPFLLMAHMDVVPAKMDELWEHEPFSGVIDADYIHGRGTLDDKGSMFGILEAAEYLLSKDFQPERTIYFAFGHDEELGGNNGAAEISKYLAQKGVALEFVLDEGGVIVDGIMPGIDKPIGLIGIAEKGSLSIKLIAKGEGGHSSMPPNSTVIGELAEAIVRLEKNPFPAKIEGVTAQMFDFVGPEMNFPLNYVFANRWLFSPVIVSQLEGTKSTNATVRTTQAVTVVKGGMKDNIIPSEAEAIVNFRILPGFTVDDVISHVRNSIANENIEIMFTEKASNPSNVSPTKSKGFEIIRQSAANVFPDAITSPFLMIAASDAKHYENLSENVYRFFPARLDSEGLKKIHGSNEKIAKENYKELIRFYHQMMVLGSGE